MSQANSFYGRFVLMIFSVFYFSTAYSQVPYFVRNDSFPVKIAGTTLKNSWAGGINFGQYSPIDLNGDGIKDLFVFQRNGDGRGKDKISTFINKGTPNTVDYFHAPQYENKFPPLHDWALLVDYNCDGKEDIFTYSSIGAGIAVYRNDYSITTGLKFTLISDLVYSTYGTTYTNLYVSAVDIPAIVDVDNDNDLDVITFDIGSNYVYLHKNFAIENTGNCDTLLYKVGDQCWGKFYENASDNGVTLNSFCKGGGGPPQRDLVNLHSGSTLLSFDGDGDGDKDLILGDISFANMVYLRNGGTVSSALIDTFDVNFPSYNTPVSLVIYPAGFYLDVNNDNKRDLLIAPNAPNASENFNGTLYYKNIGTDAAPVFSYQKKNFLHDEMIETGEGSFPVFADENGDGLLDLFIGNHGYYSSGGNYTSGLSLYRNIGTATNPSFDLLTRNYANINSLNLNSVFPAFGDMDGDGDTDLLLGESNGTLILFSNSAAAGSPFNLTLADPNYQGIDAGQFSTPQLVDVNRDGKTDLLIGERNGNLNYYQDTSTTSVKKFKLISQAWGGIDVREYQYITGYSVPCLVDFGGNYKLFIGTERGSLFLYENIDGNLAGNFTLKDSVFQKIFEGYRSSVSASDINGDGKTDLIIGNYGGGTAIYTQDTSTGISGVSPHDFHVDLFPNPASEYVTLHFSSDNGNRAEIIITDITGREVLRKYTATHSDSVLDVSHLSQGVYIVRVEAGKSSVPVKLIITD